MFNYDYFKESIMEQGDIELPAEVTQEAMNSTISRLLSFCRVVVGVPEFICKFEYSMARDKVEYVVFKLRLSTKEHTEDLLKQSFYVLVNPDFVTTVVGELSKYFAYVQEYKCACEQVNNLNKTMNEINAEAGNNFTLNFAVYDKKVKDISDDHITIGLSIEDALNIPSIPLYSGLTDALKQEFKDSISSSLKICQAPYHLFKLHSAFTDTFNIYTTCLVKTVLRKTYNFKIENVRDGFGYSDDGDEFAILHNYCVTASEEKELLNKFGAPVSRRDFSSNSKAKRDKIAIVSYYVLKPFNAKTLTVSE